MKITISAGGTPVRPDSVGLFLEDLNYAIDGGLYAEMLENRNFEAKDVCGERDRVTALDDGSYAWEAEEGAVIKIKTDRPLCSENPHYMRLTATKANVGIKNKAYDGLYLKAKTGYKISFYARSYDYKGKVFVGAEGEEFSLGKKIGLKADGKWKKYSFRVKCKTETEAAFVFRLLKEGTVHIDAFSMMPEDAVLGVFRRDLVQLLKEVNPSFLRFPGGCVMEGNGLNNRYQWKNSIGVPERRKHNWNRWAMHGANAENGFRSPFSHYGQTLGIGYYEYFRLCELIGAKAFPVVNLGMACQFMSSENVPVDDPAFETFVQEALDVVEFANGGADTLWGRVRVEMGHPAPFGLEYLGLGNEQWEEEPVLPDGTKGKNNELFRRVSIFEARLHEKYPDLKLIGTAGPGVDNESFERAWSWTRERLQEKENFVYATDEHFYVPPKWLYENANRYDSYPRTGLVCVGEFAAHVPDTGAGETEDPLNNCWEGALAEAAFLTGTERNGDIIPMKCYAPLLARVGYSQWCPVLIRFNGKSAFGTPSYYVQKLFSLYTGDRSLPVECDGKDVYVSATERDGTIFVKVVNAGEEEIETEVETPSGELARILRMEGDLRDVNSFEEPQKVAPVEVAPAAPHTLTLPPHTFTVLIFRK